MSKVCVLKVDSYDEALVYDAISKGMSMLGGIESFARKEKMKCITEK